MHAVIELPPPIRFNPVKHHRGYLREMLERASEREIIELLDPICNNWVDLYIGALNPMAVCQAVVDRLQFQGRLDRDRFVRWIRESKGFGSIQLEDGSQWVVRLGDDPVRYIHLHPARSGPLSVRYKGSTLKTIGLLRISLGGIDKSISTESVNRIRQQVGLAPVKGLEPSRGILHCYSQFFQGVIIS